MIYNHPIGKDYKWYIGGILPANWGDYMVPIPPIKGTRFHSIEQIHSRLRCPRVAPSSTHSVEASIRNVGRRLSSLDPAQSSSSNGPCPSQGSRWLGFSWFADFFPKDRKDPPMEGWSKNLYDAGFLESSKYPGL